MLGVFLATLVEFRGQAHVAWNILKQDIKQYLAEVDGIFSLFLF